jgi:septal ring factor EnvC (AmiA/AmiB activator)
MISLEQVRSLESRVEKAVSLIASLRTENASLRSGLATAESRVAELENLVLDFQKDQARIEEGIIEALRKLDSFEDSVHVAVAANKPEKGRGAVHAAPEPAENPETEKVVEADEEQVADVEPLKTAGADGTDALDLF